MRWPWRNGQKPAVARDTGGHEARERAEAALRDVRKRKPEMAQLGLWFRIDAERNHFAEQAEYLFRGGKP